MILQRDCINPIRIAMIGVGSHACRNILPALNFLPVRLVAICDPDGLKAAATARQYGVEHVYGRIDDLLLTGGIDAVLLCVGPRQHPSLAQAALAAGVDVWMEKPPAMRASEVADMIDRRGDRVAMVGFKKAFMPATDKIREIFGPGANGPLRSLVGQYPMTIDADGEAVLRDGRFTNWLGNGCHPLALMVAVAGPVERLRTLRGRLGGGILALDFASGAMGNLHLADGADLSQPMEHYRFYGAGSMAEIDNSSRVLHQRGIPFTYGVTTTYLSPGPDRGGLVWEPQNTLATLENHPLYTQGMLPSLEEFISCVRSRRAPRAGSLEQALHLMDIYEAALLSQGDAVELPPARSGAWTAAGSV